MGRTFLSEEDLSGKKVIILSHPLWVDRFQEDPDIVGRTVQVDGGGYEVIGVMPERFLHPTPWSLNDPYLAWIPSQYDQWVDNRDSHSYQLLARLREGVSLEESQENLDRIGARLEDAFPDTNEDKRAWVVPLHRLLYGEAGSLIVLILLATGAVLLIACGNIAGFLLARATTRQSEMAVRASLGAGRGRIVRQLLTESLLLALAGGAAALILASWSLGGLKALMPPTLPRTGDIDLDSGVLLFALGLSVVTGLIFGLAPAVAASRIRLTDALKEGGRGGGADKRRTRTQNSFVVVQIALSLAMANAGLLLIQSYGTLRELDQGFDSDHTLTVGISLGGERYDDLEERRAFFDQLLPRLEAIPGVRQAGVVSKLPLRGGTNGPTVTEERFAEDPSSHGILTEKTSIRGDYFASMGIRLLAGRSLGKQDDDTVARRVVINEAAAKRFWPDRNPLGRRFAFEDDLPGWYTVVGVVADVRQWGPGSTPRPEVYSDYTLNPRPRMFMTINAVGDPRDVVRPVREAVLAVDPIQPVSEIQTMGEILASDLSGREFYTLLVGLFSGLAVFLAAAGIYGVIAYFVAKRTQELGIRLALGADRGALVSMVLRQALRPVLWGIGLGLAGTWATTRMISGTLFGIQPLDPTTILGGTGILVTVALAGALLPALRGTRLSPVTALRLE